LARIGLSVYCKVLKQDLVSLRYTDSNRSSSTRRSCDTCWQHTESVC